MLDEEQGKDDFYVILGRLATTFSAIEFWVSQLFESLVDNDHVVVGGLLARDMSLRKKLDSIRKLSEYRFWKDDELQSKIVCCVEAIHDKRVIRNSLIHGIWSLHAEHSEDPIAECLDQKWNSKNMINVG